MGPNNTERQPLLPRDGTAGSSMPLLEDEEEQQQGLGLLGRRRSSVRRRRGRQELGVKAEVLDEPLPERVVWAYAFGHVLNDASAACWFSYLLIYRTFESTQRRVIWRAPTIDPSKLIRLNTNIHTVEKVRRLTAMHAGVVMFSGQILDAMATPIAGLLADATPGWPDRGLGGRVSHRLSMIDLLIGHGVRMSVSSCRALSSTTTAHPTVHPSLSDAMVPGGQRPGRRELPGGVRLLPLPARQGLAGLRRLLRFLCLDLQRGLGGGAGRCRARKRQHE